MRGHDNKNPLLPPPRRRPGAILTAHSPAIASALRPQIVDGNGYLFSYAVMGGGEVFYSDPYVWSGTREIECD